MARAPADGVRGMKDGAFDYLVKPVEIDQLPAHAPGTEQQKHRNRQ